MSICPKTCKYHSETVIARRWLKGEEKWTGYCSKYNRLLLCHDLGLDETGAKFTRLKECTRISEDDLTH